VSNLLIFDTSIFIDHLRTNCHEARLAAIKGLIRTSAVVLAELWRGASKPAERAFLKELQKNHPILTPSETNWVESAEILGKIRMDQGSSPEKLRELHFDVLIALTARANGAKVITTNRADFEMIRSYRVFSLEIW
jgi:predicted nucleic acid-binding protein